MSIFLWSRHRLGIFFAIATVTLVVFAWFVHFQSDWQCHTITFAVLVVGFMSLVSCIFIFIKQSIRVSNLSNFIYLQCIVYDLAIRCIFLITCYDKRQCIFLIFNNCHYIFSNLQQPSMYFSNLRQPSMYFFGSSTTVIAFWNPIRSILHLQTATTLFYNSKAINNHTLPQNHSPTTVNAFALTTVMSQFHLFAHFVEMHNVNR